MKIKYPDYTNSILNVTSSILKYYDCQTEYNTIEELDLLLQKDYKHVFLLLLDGMGLNLIKRLKKTSGLKKHFVKPLTSVFPPTTVAATTAVLSGLPPYASGHVGWVQYFKAEDCNTVVFKNEDFYNPARKLARNLQECLQFENILSKINKQKNIETFEIFPNFRVNGFDSFHDEVNRIIDISKQENRTFSYLYWTEPDTTEHDYGIKCSKTDAMMEELNKEYERLFDVIGNSSLVITIADHGLIDIEENYVFEHQDLVDCFSKNPSIEPRTCSFFIQTGKREVFKKLFSIYYGKKFMLFERDEFYRSGLLGTGKKHPMLDDFIGDFIAVAIKRYSLSMKPEKGFKAHHAGLTEAEMMVPLILFDKR